MCINIKQPIKTEIEEYIKEISTKENIKLTKAIINKIIINSTNNNNFNSINIKKILHGLELLSLNKTLFNNNNKESDIHNKLLNKIIDLIIKRNLKLNELTKLREYLYELYSLNLDSSFILNILKIIYLNYQH